MASTKLYLDCRRASDKTAAPLKIAIRNKNTTAYIPLQITLLPSQWDAKESKVKNNHPSYKMLNARINAYKSSIDMEIMTLAEKCGISRMTAREVKYHILKELNPDQYSEPKQSFLNCFQSFMSKKDKRSTKEIYQHTLSRLRAFCDVESLKFEDITPEWLSCLEASMAKTSPSKNARNIHLRNIRAVFNFAIDNGYTTAYPFRRFKIRPEATRKRSLPVDDLRELFSCPVEKYAEIYRDMFKLIFYLIGINTVDLHRLKNITHDGRIEYKRAKTGKLYSIKVEPEAMEIIEKYRGEKGLLCIADRWSDHRNFRHQCNKALQNIGEFERKGRGGKKIITSRWPELTTYWARHSWATIAASLDIPKDTIAHALGHGNNTVTDIYIDFDQRKVDEANRRVLDWVLYGKK